MPARGTVFVVDDDPALLEVISRLLRSAGHIVETFSSEDLLAQHDADAPGCVTLDLQMPGVDGFAVQARLRQAALGIPVIVVTGHDSDETRNRALAGGAAAYLHKPVHDQTLLDAISAAVPAISRGRSAGRGT